MKLTPKNIQISIYMGLIGYWMELQQSQLNMLVVRIKFVKPIGCLVRPANSGGCINDPILFPRSLISWSHNVTVSPLMSIWVRYYKSQALIFFGVYLCLSLSLSLSLSLFSTFPLFDILSLTNQPTFACHSHKYLITTFGMEFIQLIL